jgi:hypothetical protein
MRLFSEKHQPALTDEMIATDALSRGGSEDEVRAVLSLPPRPASRYRLYRDETACDSDDFGPPRGVYPALALAMVATGLPVSAWQSLSCCPDEIFTVTPGGEVDWQILAPGAATEYAALAAARADPITGKENDSRNEASF